ncbi:MAG: hypothetical protein QG629_603 [Patescibacteria group bacterium]|nr:hypothetical protein [Candidatus Saccharibacteria bacterium]MDQ5963521.1 hypothetical protein [Patescibacteria group bacterium]
MRRQRVRNITFASLTALLLIAAVGPFAVWRTEAAELATRQLTMSSNITSATAQYELSFSGQSTGTVGSVRLQLCANDPFYGTPCVAPAGLDLSAASLTGQTGMTGFSIDPSSSANELVLTRTPAASIAGLATYTLQGVKNASSQGTVFGRIETFASTDATGPRTDAAGLAIAYLDSAIGVQSTVPPYLLFCIGNTVQAYDCSTANGNFTDFGDFSITSTATGQTQMIVATNAEFGYTIRAMGTTLTSGTNVIPALATPDIARKGVSQFGMNLRANGVPPVGHDVMGGGSGVIRPAYNAPNYFAFIPGDTLVQSPTPEYKRLFTVTYMANISKNQPPGAYVSTLTYVALASF